MRWCEPQFRYQPASLVHHAELTGYLQPILAFLSKQCGIAGPGHRSSELCKRYWQWRVLSAGSTPVAFPRAGLAVGQPRFAGGAGAHHYYNKCLEDAFFHAVLWQKDGKTDLGTLPGNPTAGIPADVNSVAVAINDSKL
jgi:hypothetical protein